MKIDQLTLTNFRNYKALDIEFNEGLTILTGKNAQGKTNLLEAIFLLALSKSHRTTVDSELISWNQEFAKIEAIIQKKDYPLHLALHMSKKGKIAKVNHLEQARLSTFIGHVNVILFAPEDLQLIKGSPSLRRKFIDSELAQVQPIYLQELLTYQHLLKQRNKYLKDFSDTASFDALFFDILTDQLIDKAVSIVHYRQEFIQQLSHITQPLHDILSNHRDHLTIEYISSSSKLDYSQLDSLYDQFKELFKQNLDREKKQKMTVYGPHRDDLFFYLNGQTAQQFGSQGQQRTIVLSIKLAETELLNQIVGDYPILLLDDVLSELDQTRQTILMEHIEGKIQTFLTTATIEGLELTSLDHLSLYSVEAGTVSEMKRGSSFDN